jgi:hypothetical protein
MTDDRYTVEDPPEEGEWVWCPEACLGETELYQTMYRTNAECKEALKAGALHRTPESAEAQARRMLMADEILEALEAMVLAAGRPGTAQNLAVLGANRVIARARGEVAG